MVDSKKFKRFYLLLDLLQEFSSKKIIVKVSKEVLKELEEELEELTTEFANNSGFIINTPTDNFPKEETDFITLKLPMGFTIEFHTDEKVKKDSPKENFPKYSELTVRVVRDTDMINYVGFIWLDQDWLEPGTSSFDREVVIMERGRKDGMGNAEYMVALKQPRKYTIGDRIRM